MKFQRRNKGKTLDNMVRHLSTKRLALKCGNIWWNGRLALKCGNICYKQGMILIRNSGGRLKMDMLAFDMIPETIVISQFLVT